MYVVRLKRPGEDSDLRAFGSRRAAVARFRTAQREIIDGEIEACALIAIDARPMSSVPLNSPLRVMAATSKQICRTRSRSILRPRRRRAGAGRPTGG